MKKEIIFDDEYLRVIFVNRGSDKLVITFGDMVTLANGMDTFADKPLDKNNFTNICFMAKAPNWYPLCSMLKAINCLDEILRKHIGKIVGYSGSMGGYALIKYSKKLNLNKIIVLVPQYSIDHKDIKDHRYNKYYSDDIHSDMRIKFEDISDSCEFLIIYDKYCELDRIHAEKILDLIRKKSISYKIILLNFSGHHAVRVLASSDLLKIFIDNSIFSRVVFDEVKRVKRSNLFFLNHSFKIFFLKKNYLNLLEKYNLFDKLNLDNKRLLSNKMIFEERYKEDFYLEKDYLLSHHGQVLFFNTKSLSINCFDVGDINKIKKIAYPLKIDKGNLCFDYNGKLVFLYRENEKIYSSLESFLYGYISLVEYDQGFVIHDNRGVLLSSEKNGLCNFRADRIGSWEIYKKLSY